MQITKSGKLLLGVATAIVTIGPVLFVAGLLILILGVNSSPTSVFDTLLQNGFASVRDLLAALVCGLNLLIYGVVAFYIVHLVKNVEGSQGLRIGLALLLFFFPLLGMPAYYFIYILPAQPPQWALEKRPMST